MEVSTVQVSVPLELFCRWEKPHLQELPDQSIRSLAICWAMNSHAKARRLVHGQGGEHTNTSRSPSPVPAQESRPSLKCTHCHLLHGDLAHFCRMRHWITKCSGHILPPSHRSVQGKEHKVILSFAWFKTTSASARSRCSWTTRGLLSKVTSGAANDALCVQLHHRFS